MGYKQRFPKNCISVHIETRLKPDNNIIMKTAIVFVCIMAIAYGHGYYGWPRNMLHQSVQKKFVQPVKIMDLPLIKQPLKPIVMNNVTNVNSVLEMLLKLYQNAKNFA